MLYLRSVIILLVRGGVQSLQKKTASFDSQAGRKVVPDLPPYVEHPYSAARFEAGLPIPVTCCWNGIVNIDAAPLAKGVRFRYTQWLRSKDLNLRHSLHLSISPAVTSCPALQCTTVGRYWVLASNTAPPQKVHGCQGMYIGPVQTTC